MTPPVRTYAEVHASYVPLERPTKPTRRTVRVSSGSKTQSEEKR
jgi:hypothetical protein